MSGERFDEELGIRRPHPWLLGLSALAAATGAGVFAYTLALGGSAGAALYVSAPFLLIARVEPYVEGLGAKVGGVRVGLANGEEVKLPLGSYRWDGEEVPTLIERIREAVNGSRGDHAGVAPVLARGERPLAEWVRTLRGIGAGAVATLRTAAVDPERLWKVLESPGAEPKDRAAAAIALSASEEQGNRERIRIAADAIAQPKLRVAVIAASNEDEAALLEALAGLDEQVGAHER